jgi:Tfp pilus assembly protein PilV
MHAPTPARTSGRRSRRQGRGFTLVEALVAMAVAAFGLFGLLATQTMLARQSDAAKHRTEAVRLAQSQLEAMRSYTTLEAVPGQDAWADLASDDDTVTTSTVFERRWTVGGAVEDPMRPVNVTVAWTDRAGQAHTVSLDSFITRLDPRDAGALGFPLPGNTTLKRPKNRSMNIPVPATDLGNGKSAFQIAGNFAVVFDNASGYVTLQCNHAVEEADDLDSGCVTYEGVIVAGYVSRSSGSFPSGLGISTAGLVGLDSSRSVQCSFSDAVNQNTGAIISTHKYYLCVLPLNTGGAWSGTVRLRGMSTGTNYRVCRFQYPAASGVSVNARNVQPYSMVNDSLDNQNYVLTTSGSCPSVSGLATTLHQNCSSGNVARLTDCPL